MKIQPLSTTQYPNEMTRTTPQTHSKAQNETQPEKVQRVNNQQQTDNVELRDLEYAVDEITDAFDDVIQSLSFSVHEDTGRVMVSVIDQKTQDVIKEIPPEKMLDMIARLRDMIGFFIDERA